MEFEDPQPPQTFLEDQVEDYVDSLNKKLIYRLLKEHQLWNAFCNQYRVDQLKSRPSNQRQIQPQRLRLVLPSPRNFPSIF